MNEKAAPSVHWSFWVIAAVALIWNGMGVMNYMMQHNPEAVASMPEAQRAIIEGRPAWATGAFAIAVFGGLVGSALLLLKKSWAFYAFIASLVGVIVQSLHYFNVPSLGGAQLVMYLAMPLIVAAFLVWYPKLAQGKGWIR